ncbi:MAG: hypothetical protein HQ494_06210 [Rhodospirillales bacterium]|nr:hypothetical protein [Rhodospirillales bacterium]
MGDTPTGASAPDIAPGGGADEPIPFMQQVLDNPFLLLFLGITIPTVFYILWGIMEVISIPIAN